MAAATKSATGHAKFMICLAIRSRNLIADGALMASNENKISDAYRERALIGGGLI